MTKTFFKTLWTIAVLLSLLLLLTPPALAAGVDAGTDAIEVSPDGTVTLLSGHIAGEGVSSVQFQLRTEGDVQFSFAGDIAGGYLTNCVAGDGTLDVYIAGTAPLMQPGYTSRVLGTVSPADKAQPVQSSLRYVYGVNTVAQNVSLGPEAESGEPKAQLQSVLDAANAMFSAENKYSEESWAKLNAAIDEIVRLLESDAVTQEQVNDAIKAYNQACIDLVIVGSDDLGAVLESARAIDASLYTPNSYSVLADAISAAETVLAKGDGAGPEEVEQAISALRAAMEGLVSQQSADGSGGVIGDGADNGTMLRSAPAPEQGGGTGDGGDGSGSGSSGTQATTSAGSVIPATGDETDLAPWLAVMCLCGGLLAVLLRRVRTQG